MFDKSYPIYGINWSEVLYFNKASHLKSRYTGTYGGSRCVIPELKIIRRLNTDWPSVPFLRKGNPLITAIIVASI